MAAASRTAIALSTSGGSRRTVSVSFPLTPYLSSLLADLKRINETPPKVKKIKGSEVPQKWQPSQWVFFSKVAANGRIAEPRILHNRIDTGNQGFGLRLRGTTSNPYGIGARIEVTVAPGAPVQHHPEPVRHLRGQHRPRGIRCRADELGDLAAQLDRAAAAWAPSWSLRLWSFCPWISDSMRITSTRMPESSLAKSSPAVRVRAK